MNADVTDSVLLERFARGRDQQAFAQLVHRYGGLVYSAAMRQVGPSLAEDASQAVFFILAHKAQRVDGRTLAGWLVKAARLTAMASQRSELRRRQREQRAALMKHESIDESQDDGRAPYEALAPMLDEALARLGEKDRSAVTLRYLQGKSVREVAATMSLSEAAAGKRATRGLRALRDYFARRGVKLPVESLGCALAAHSMVAMPLGLAGKLTATAATTAAATGVAATLSGSAAAMVDGALPLMLSAKTHVLAAVAAILLLGGGGAFVVSQFFSGWDVTAAALPTGPANPQVFDAAAGQSPTTLPAAVAPSGPEIFTPYATPAGGPARFNGRVEGLLDPATAEVGIVYLRGTHWLSNDNYQWQPVKPDGTFRIIAEKYPQARRTLAVRAAGQSVTFMRVEFDSDQSARNILVRMKPTRQVTFAANNSRGEPIYGFKAEIFDGSIRGTPLRDDKGRALGPQRLEAPVSSGGVITTTLPLEPVSVLVSGDRIAPYFQMIDPRASDHCVFNLLTATKISGTVTENGVPVAGVPVSIYNDAVPLSAVNRKTDAEGRWERAAGIPGTYTIRVRNRTIQVPLIEGEPRHVEIDLATLELDQDAAQKVAAATERAAAIRRAAGIRNAAATRRAVTTRPAPSTQPSWLARARDLLR